MKNLIEYKVDELKDIASQLMIEETEMEGLKKAQLVELIQNKAAELNLENIPEPTPTVEAPTVESAQKKKVKVSDSPRKKVIITARDEQIKEQYFGLNEYNALVKMDEKVELPVPVIDMIKTCVDIKHEKDEEGNVKAKEVKRFLVETVE